MAPLLLLNADHVRSLIDLPALFDALERALRDLSAGNTSVPPRTVARTRDGFLGSMPGYLPGTLGAKLVAVFPGNHERGLPSHQALIALFDEETGMPLCVMDGTVITAVRTGATAAVAARALAREGARSLAILGAAPYNQRCLTIKPPDAVAIGPKASRESMWPTRRPTTPGSSAPLHLSEARHSHTHCDPTGSRGRRCSGRP